MTGLKTNERPGTRATVKYVRSSAYKAREVLDQIRGKSYGEATDILAFSERSVSEPIMKVLDSAVANAEHNDSLEAEDLYVSACYADEGPTLKRWRPRARGRATRIRKRTCHITVIVSPLRRRRARGPARAGGQPGPFELGSGVGGPAPAGRTVAGPRRGSPRTRRGRRDRGRSRRRASRSRPPRSIAATDRCHGRRRPRSTEAE